MTSDLALRMNDRVLDKVVSYFLVFWTCAIICSYRKDCLRVKPIFREVRGEGTVEKWGEVLRTV